MRTTPTASWEWRTACSSPTSCNITPPCDVGSWPTASRTNDTPAKPMTPSHRCKPDQRHYAPGLTGSGVARSAADPSRIPDWPGSRHLHLRLPGAGSSSLAPPGRGGSGWLPGARVTSVETGALARSPTLERSIRPPGKKCSAAMLMGPSVCINVVAGGTEHGSNYDKYKGQRTNDRGPMGAS